MRTLDIPNICLQTYRNNRIRFKKKYKLYGRITREFIRFRMRNFHDIIFIWAHCINLMLYFLILHGLILHYLVFTDWCGTFNVALFNVALFNVALFLFHFLMLHSFNVLLFRVALFDVGPYIVAWFTVARFTVALCECCTILMFLYFNIVLFDVALH